jgi:hypothetical protein
VGRSRPLQPTSGKPVSCCDRPRNLNAPGGMTRSPSPPNLC